MFSKIADRLQSVADNAYEASEEAYEQFKTSQATVNSARDDIAAASAARELIKHTRRAKNQAFIANLAQTVAVRLDN